MRAPSFLFRCVLPLLLLAAPLLGQPRIESQFKRLDRNGDGRLSRTELRRPLLFELLDLDGDGLVTLAEVRQSRREGEESSAMRVIRDLPYRKIEGVKPALLSLDLHLPARSEAQATPRPLMVMIHGGGWSIGDKASRGVCHPKAEHFAGLGYAFASINYRLSPAVKHPAHVEDVAHALVWLARHAEEYGYRGEDLIVVGHSAGAHLAALVATDPRPLRDAGSTTGLIGAVVLLDGAGYDIPRHLDRDFVFPRVRRMYESAFGTDRKTWAAASPITHVTEGRSYPPFLCVHAAARLSSRDMARALAARLRKVGGIAEVHAAEGKDHGAVNKDLGKPEDPMTRAVTAFLQRMEARRAAAKEESR